MRKACARTLFEKGAWQRIMTRGTCQPLKVSLGRAGVGRAARRGGQTKQVRSGAAARVVGAAGFGMEIRTFVQITHFFNHLLIFSKLAHILHSLWSARSRNACKTPGPHACGPAWPACVSVLCCFGCMAVISICCPRCPLGSTFKSSASPACFGHRAIFVLFPFR